MQTTSTNTDQQRTRACTDRELIELVRQGDQTAFARLVARHQDRLFQSMFTNVGCRQFAEDVVQDAFIQAFVHLDAFQNRSNFYTWIYRIALNARRSHFRRRREALHLDVMSDAAVLFPTSTCDNPDRFAERAEERDLVRLALKRLPTHHRTILVLREFDGLNYKEIAEAMNLNLGTVRSRLARARARLKDELTD